MGRPLNDGDGCSIRLTDASLTSSFEIVPFGRVSLKEVPFSPSCTNATCAACARIAVSLQIASSSACMAAFTHSIPEGMHVPLDVDSGGSDRVTMPVREGCLVHSIRIRSAERGVGTEW